ncbi:hypothetical protein [Promicromonospora sp. NPDC023987]|uniref:hypothetical protein n=1 Tax=Promicromonospora sp. NPDC023987 TaxID=3155360 RepID=UPI0033F38A6B
MDNRAIAELAYDIALTVEEEDYWTTWVEPVQGITTDDYVRPTEYVCDWLRPRLEGFAGLDRQEVKRKVDKALHSWMLNIVSKDRQGKPGDILPEPLAIPEDQLMDILTRAEKRADGLVRRRKNIRAWGTVKDVARPSGEHVAASEYWSDGYIYLMTHTRIGDDVASTIRKVADAMADWKERDESLPQPPRKNGSRERILPQTIDIVLETMAAA